MKSTLSCDQMLKRSCYCIYWIDFVDNYFNFLPKKQYVTHEFVSIVLMFRNIQVQLVWWDVYDIV